MATEEKTKTGDQYDTAYGDRMQESVSHFLESSDIKSNGVRNVPKAAYVKALEKHGVTEADIKRVNTAIDFENTAAARVAVQDLESKISEASKEDLEKEEFRKGLSATVRLPTFGGSTDVTVNAEVFNNIPFRGDGDGEPQRKASYGRLRTTINTKGRIHPDFHAEADSRMRKALGIESAVE